MFALIASTHRKHFFRAIIYKVRFRLIDEFRGNSFTVNLQVKSFLLAILGLANKLADSQRIGTLIGPAHPWAY